MKKFLVTDERMCNFKTLLGRNEVNNSTELVTSKITPESIGTTAPAGCSSWVIQVNRWHTQKVFIPESVTKGMNKRCKILGATDDP